MPLNLFSEVVNLRTLILLGSGMIPLRDHRHEHTLIVAGVLHGARNTSPKHTLRREKIVLAVPLPSGRVHDVDQLF